MIFGRAWWRARGRRIFRYFDGTCTRWVDPLELYRRIEDVGGKDWEKHLATLAQSPPPAGAAKLAGDYHERQATATTELVRVTRAAFRVAELDSATAKGLTSAECVSLMTEFLCYMGGLADEASPFVNSPRPVSESTPPHSRIPSSADSGSIVTPLPTN